MGQCKFCGVLEGEQDRRGAATHINRDGLCTYCYKLLADMRKDPEKVRVEDRAWYMKTCKENVAHGRFVPVALRKTLKKWACKKCGATRGQDEYYKCYCSACADVVRHDRQMPAKSNRKTRSDKGSSHTWGRIIVH